MGESANRWLKRVCGESYWSTVGILGTGGFGYCTPHCSTVVLFSKIPPFLLKHSLTLTEISRSHRNPQRLKEVLPVLSTHTRHTRYLFVSFVLFNHSKGPGVKGPS